jgi:spore maturation protein CgeB
MVRCVCGGGGLRMSCALVRSRVMLNRHINVAENNANKTRLYEATGVGSLLIKAKKDNFGELFEVWKEAVAYNSTEEVAELIRCYTTQPEEEIVIPRAGRTLRDHTYQSRLQDLAPL